MAEYRKIPTNAPCYSMVAAVGEVVWCIGVDELSVSGSTLKSGVSRQRKGETYCWPHHKEGRKIWLHVKGLKDEYRAMFPETGIALSTAAESLPATSDSLQANAIEMSAGGLQIIETKEITKYFSEKSIDETGRVLPTNKIEEYTHNAVLLEAVGTYLKQATTTRGVWQGLIEKINSIDKTRYYHSLPTTERRLRDKYMQYSKLGCSCLVNGRFANSNSSVIKSNDQIAVLEKLIAHGNVLDGGQIASLYNDVAIKNDWETISQRTVGVWLSKRSLEVSASRHGKSEFYNNQTMQVRRSAPTFPLYYWTVDGWDAEVLYQKKKIDKNGHSATTYHNRMTIVFVLDPCTKYIIGYAIGDHETPTLIKKALRNAINHTREIFGKRYAPHQLQTDGYGNGCMKKFYEDICRIYTPARVGNAKSKVIEPFNNYFNKTYCQFSNSWSGFGITSKKSHQPNIDRIAANKKYFPSEKECVEELANYIEIDRLKKQQQYLEKWQEMPEEDRREMAVRDYLDIFGEITSGNHLTGQGLTPRIGGERRYFDSFDINFRKHRLTEWFIKYDPQDLSIALAQNEDGSLKFMLEEKFIQPMALMDRKAGDAAQLERVSDFNKTLTEYVTDSHKTRDEAFNQFIERDPRTVETLSKLLITDSRGRHKDRLAEACGKAAHEYRELPQQVENEMSEVERKASQENRKIIRAKMNARYNIDNFNLNK